MDFQARYEQIKSLSAAVEAGDLQKVKELCEQGADVADEVDVPRIKNPRRERTGYFNRECNFFVKGARQTAWALGSEVFDSRSGCLGL